MSVLGIITLLIFLAALFTFINIRFLKLPSTIGLMILALIMSVVIVGMGYFWPELKEGAANIMTKFDFSTVLLEIMLSFLLFAGALHINLQKLAEERYPILALAFFGTLLSTAIVGFITFYVFNALGIEIEFIYCLLFGALISPTDPIAVLALVKKMNVSDNLETKIAGESLFNDGIGVVVFLTILQVAVGGSGHGGSAEAAGNINAGSVALLFGQEVIGGVGLGAIFGLLGFQVLKAIDNAHVELEVLVTLSMVMAGTQLAKGFHVSAPLAMVTMGLFVGNQGRKADLSNITGDYVYKFWHLVDEALNAILFILIGLEMIIIPFQWDYVLAGVIGILVVLVGRFIGVSTPVTIMSPFRKFEKGTIQILTWGGLRGGISVALALSLPEIAAKDLIVTATYSVVVFSILVQGLTIGGLIKRLGVQKAE